MHIAIPTAVRASEVDRAAMVEMRKHLDGSGVYLEVNGDRLLRYIREDIEEWMYSEIQE